ncbi:MAG TPA: bifunctional adenosylcobinamide kinase/adenosylcobinamide-phosphate guanylyltransferase [Aestuariivirga sp.]|jgi:adenosylcobinamide kinase/adenosylcobinamide-phosphate guanylyltransferase|nr:bifunctional adenosylcobinamide kinase/adenosylcobinamide-phosphate guanylyltransferase [Aestuariivirga sp.]
MSIHLILGGARSGKSRYAESLSKGRKFYIATAEASDEEMQQRIDTHRKQRGQGWETFDVPLDLVGALQTIDGKGRFILIDCLTIWLSNLMLVKLDVRAEIEMLCECLTKIKSRVVLVSNEVGLGIVPANVLARTFRDDQGFLNQRVAEIADEVIFMTAGLPMALKRAKRKARPDKAGKSSRSRKA